MAKDIARPSAPALPSTVEDLEKHRRVSPVRTLNDHVEDIHLILWPDPKYRAFLEAVYDEQAVEGSLVADNLEAAQMIRLKAVELGNHYFDGLKKATISKALNVVMRRFDGLGGSRQERRNMVDGEIIAGNGE